MREKQIERRGISLIVLVIVIIVLLVLSVTVILTVSKSNLIDGARKAVEEYNKSVLKEEETLKELDELLANKNESLPENTKENPQEPGTNVKLPSNWSNANCAYYVSTLDGNIEKKEVEVASVMAVAIGDGETVPVPNGFYYVGGNLDTGVVISDNLNDKYDGKINKTSFEYTTSLQGNQFVWIPCTEESYKKISWEKQNA